jgi:hypothetical protein
MIQHAIEREHLMGAGAARLAAVRSHDDLEEVATETARGLVGRDAWVDIWEFMKLQTVSLTERV